MTVPVLIIVACASDAFALLDQPDQSAIFDLAIIDFKMPELDGLTLASEIRKSIPSAKFPIILYSSKELQLGERQLRQQGVDLMLLKAAKSELRQQGIMSVLAAKTSELTTDCSSTVRYASGDVESTLESERSEVMEEQVVLIEEDNEINQLIIASMLEELALDLVFAENEQLAFDRYTELQSDLVLMDWSMPVINGLQATRMIREYESEHRLASCPIVALTANAMKGDDDICLEAGMDGYLTNRLAKPPC